MHSKREKIYKRKDERFTFIDEKMAEHSARFEDIVWDKAELVQLLLSPQLQFEDAFLITEVKEEYVFGCHYGMRLYPLRLPQS